MRLNVEKDMYMSDVLQSLLNQISEIVKEENTQRQIKYGNGEAFNVFKILRLERKEERLHSSFIATLLDPNGPHGLNSKLLEALLSVFQAEDILQGDLRTIHVETEKFIGPISRDGNNGGCMDIVLTDKHGNGIIIENKIDAKDQPKQLLRYNNYCKTHYKRYKIYYLTKWGLTPSEESTGGQHFEYKTVSYYEDIISWLYECINLTETILPVKESIKQYLATLIDILNIMSQNNIDKLLSVTTDEKYIESTITILENQKSIGDKIRFDFLQKLIELAEQYGFKGDKEEAEKLAKLNKGCCLHLRSYSRSNNYAITIGNERPSYGFWFGIEATTKRKVSKAALQQLEQQWGKQDPKRKRIDYPYGWDFFWSETGEDESGQWWKWDDLDTLRAMSNGRLISFIEKEILRTIVEKRLLEGLEEAIV